MTANGIDYYNGNARSYDFRRVAADLGAGAFTVGKASQGYIGGPGGWKDWEFVAATAKARAAGIRRVGGYHWLLHGAPELQAQNFAEALDAIGGRGKVGAFLDFERNDWNQALNPTMDDAVRFAAECRRIGIPGLVIYTAPWYSDAYAGGAHTLHDLGFPVWWAGYSGAGNCNLPDGLRTVTPMWMQGFDGWTSYAIRQWASSVYIAGVQSDVDVTYLPDPAVDAMFGLGGKPPPQPAPLPSADGPGRYDNLGVTLQQGSTDASSGGKVHILQLSLNAVTARPATPVGVDGSFGPGTRAAVVQYQRNRGLAPDGVVGHVTWHDLGVLLTQYGIKDVSARKLARLAVDHPERLALPPTHILHPSFADQPELYRKPEHFALRTA